jgi:hypothetical protein
MIMKVRNDTMVIVGHQLIVLIASATLMVQASAQRPNAPNQPSVLPAKNVSTNKPLMAVVPLPLVSHMIAHAKMLNVCSLHQHANTMRIALPLHTMTAAQHTLVSAISHSVVIFNWLIAQKVTSELSSRPTNVAQLLDVLNVHQKPLPSIPLQLLQLQQLQSSLLQQQPSSLRQQVVVPVTPRMARLSTMVKSGQSPTVKHAAVPLSSLLNAQRLNVLPQQHAQKAKSSLVNTKLISAAHQSAVLQNQTATNVKRLSALM